MRSFFLSTSLVMLALSVRAQPSNSDCSDAVRLCAGQRSNGNNTGAVGLPGFCPGSNSLVWYDFMTNSQGGPVTVRVSGMDCLQVTGMGSALSLVVLAGDGTCTPASFGAVSDCALGSQAFSVVTQDLLPATRYWVVVAGGLNGGATIPAQCAFRVEVDGPGADVVGVDFSAGPDVTVGQGEVVRLEAFGGPPYDWSPTSGLSGNNIPDPIASPNGTTTYTVTTQIGGCTFSDEVVVHVVRRIDPPNTFTPNGDGINDRWEIPGIMDYPGAEVLIYDRWGQLVYRNVGYRDPWDGTNNGRQVPEATYYYHIQLNQLEGRSPPYTGFISIVR